VTVLCVGARWDASSACQAVAKFQNVHITARISTPCHSIVTPSYKGGGTCFCLCSFVCLLERLLKKACMDLDEMLRVDRCRDMDELIKF